MTAPSIELSQKALAMTEARNQMPTMLLFQNGLLVDQRLGAQSSVQLQDWIGAAAGLKW